MESLFSDREGWGDSDSRVSFVIQKARARFGSWQRAGVIAAEDAVAGVGDDVISPVAQRTGRDAEDGCGERPNAPELTENEDNCIGAGE